MDFDTQQTNTITLVEAMSATAGMGFDLQDKHT